MPVVCDQCGTGNRESAKFCKGCAAKLPSYAATGPSALQTMKALRVPHATPPLATETPGMLPIETRAFWIRFAVLSVVITTVFVSWYAYVTRKVPLNHSPAPPAAVAAAAPAPTQLNAGAIPLAPADHERLPVSEPVRPAEALGPTESLVAPGPVQGELVQVAPPPRRGNDAQAVRSEESRKVVARSSAADPRPACAHLNFIAAARCEAAQCAKAQYYKHPHCDAVRDQTRRDVARRNPLQLGY
ncbi:hypothetical protein H4CHR_02812 [Variovorax sp. PBS-H4]|uniref:hypothetical protein n=1 Tax=Variovorax sp. PBS-H4 TaxID=434008 RepID=UPI0013191E67|nr:hypothetical protein [Variovorax sp. PBS-H4]VTU31465.1 hypothetical protein H4CHR_02812 [Variovorax sp. PBS-H4]